MFGGVGKSVNSAGMAATDVGRERLREPSVLVTVIVFLEQFDGVFGGSIKSA